MNDEAAHDLTKPQDDFATRVTELAASAWPHFTSIRTNGDHELMIVYLDLFDDKLIRAARRIGPPQGESDSTLTAVAGLAALRRAIAIEKLAREHCAAGGMDDIETARKHAADNYDAGKDWSDETLASYWSTLPTPGPDVS